MNTQTPEQSIAALQQARDVTLWMSQGILPSKEKAWEARVAIRDFQDGAFTNNADTDLKGAAQVTGFAHTGTLPSQDKCNAAAREIEIAIDALRETDTSDMRRRLLAADRG